MAEVVMDFEKSKSPFLSEAPARSSYSSGSLAWTYRAKNTSRKADNNDKNLAFLLKSDKKLLVIHHKGQSNGGLITNSFDAFESASTMRFKLVTGYADSNTSGG